jgi:hypothetical protein
MSSSEPAVTTAIPSGGGRYSLPTNGFSITYAEIDGVPVCIFDDGEWCERDVGHDGPHVLRPMEDDE